MSNQENNTDELWDAIRGLTPALRTHIKVYPQTFRGERWYVLLDEVSGNHLRINEHAYDVIGRFDGVATLESIVDVAQNDVASEDAPGHDDIVRLISQLHHLGALNGIRDKSTAQLVGDFSNRESRQRIQKLLSPLMIKVPLFDPDQVLEKLSPRSNWLFSGISLVVWCAVVLAGFSVSMMYLPEIRSEFSADILKPRNLVLLWLLYPLIKLVHEFAHAICVKRWGGEVHEMGVTFLVLTPVPYVNASAASAFKSKWKRCLVSAAGIMVELFLASIAIVLWALSEPGIFNDCMLGIFLIGAISTVLFNANPLLRFDGYFVLQDLIEIPNLFSRSSAWYRYAFKRYVLRLQGVSSPQTAEGENRWFAVYGLASFLYRCFVIIAIVAFLLGKYLVVGAALAIWALIQQILLPLVRLTRYMTTSDELDARRSGIFKVAGVGALVVGSILLFLPLPQSTRAEGVVWVPEQAQLYAGGNGFVETIHVEPGKSVEEGQVIAKLSDPELALRLRVEESRLRTLEIEHRIALADKKPEFASLEQDVKQQSELVDHLRELNELLTIRAQASGVLTLPQNATLVGRYFSQGDLIGHIVDPGKYIVQAVVPESDSVLIHGNISEASVMLAEQIGKRHTAHVSREIPAANNRLPSSALGVMGGGGIAVASADEKGLTTIEKVFHLHLEFDQPLSVSGVGERAFVKPHHDYEPLATRWFRSLQQVFLENIPMWVG